MFTYEVHILHGLTVFELFKFLSCIKAVIQGEKNKENRIFRIIPISADTHTVFIG